MFLYLVAGFIAIHIDTSKLKTAPLAISAIALPAASCVARAAAKNIPFAENFVFASYTAPGVFLHAVSLLLLFSRMEDMKSGWLKSLVKFVAPSVFGVYLIHDNHHIRKLFIDDRFTDLPSLRFFGTALSVAACAVAIFTACVAINALRRVALKSIRRHV